MQRQEKNFSFAIKAMDDAQGIIEGYLSVFGNVDEGKDRVLPGAFKRTLQNHAAAAKQNNDTYLFPVLYQHDASQPIGGCLEAQEDGHGLFWKIQLDLDTQKGRECYSAYKKGYMNQFSIGYDAVAKDYDKAGVRNLAEVRLWEGSCVTFAMNPEALTTAVKQKEGRMHKDFNDHYREQCIADWLADFSDMTYALYQTCMDAFDIGDAPQQDIPAALTGPGGFVEAMAAWTQKGIDLDVSNYLDNQNQSGNSLFATMSNPQRFSVKAGRMFSQANTDAIAAHTAKIKDMATEAKSFVAEHVKSMNATADDLSRILGGQAYAGDSDADTNDNAENQKQLGHSFQKTLPTSVQEHASEELTADEEKDLNVFLGSMQTLKK